MNASRLILIRLFQVAAALGAAAIDRGACRPYSAKPTRRSALISRQWLRFLIDQLNVDPDGPGRFEQLAASLIHRRKAPNIVPATSPSSGGDHGVDSRTAPTLLDSESLFRLYASPPEASGRWIFAFSIRTDWEAKLRADVKQIVDNKLHPDRIVFVTSRRISPERVKLDAEEDLSAEYGIPVEILDGAWFELHLLAEDYQLAVRHLGAPRVNDPEMRAFAQRVFGLKRSGLSEEEALEADRLRRCLRLRGKPSEVLRWDAEPELYLLDHGGSW